MREICPNTERVCPVQTLYNAYTAEHGSQSLAGRHLSGRRVRAANEQFIQSREDLLGVAQKLCTNEVCGIVALGSVLSMNDAALEDAKKVAQHG